MQSRFFSRFCVLTLLSGVCAATLVLGKSAFADQPLTTDSWKNDGLPFIYPRENKTLEAIWTFLQSRDANHDPETTRFSTDFTTLRQQSRSLKGKIVHIEGRLLRTTFVPIQSAGQTNNANDANKVNGATINGYYDSWVLLDDEKSIPARLLTTRIPSLFQVDSPNAASRNESAAQNSAQQKPGAILYRQERISAVGVYYRQTAYSDGDDFYTAPTVVAESFDVLSAPILAENPKSVAKPNTPFFVFQVVAVLAAVGLWLMIRRKIQRKASPRSSADFQGRPEKIPDDFAFHTEALELLKQNDSSKKPLELPTATSDRKPPILPLILGAAILLCARTNVSAADIPEKDAPREPAASGAITLDLSFWEAITGLDVPRLAPENLSDETPDERSETLSRMLDRLNRNLPDSVFIENLSTQKPDEFFSLWPENFGRTIRFSGEVAALEPESGGENSQTTRFLITVVDENQKRLRVITSTLPKAWGKTVESALGKRIAGIGVYFRPQMRDDFPEPVLLAKCPAYYDDTTSAGRLGADLTFFDNIEPISVRDLDKITDRVERSRRLDQFRLTAEDTRPFYGLLATVSQLKPGALAAEARQRSETDGSIAVVDLFNRPEKFTQAAVTFSGNIKRARKISIHDPEVRACFGLDHYYELYLFTNDSQSYPIVCCTPTIPDGFPLGIGDDYRQNGTISGIFYKPWGFKIDAKQEQNLDDLSSWIAVPLLIAGDLVWQPENTVSTQNVPSSRLILSLFFAMAAVFWFYRRLRSKREPLEFKVGEFPSDFPRQS